LEVPPGIRSAKTKPSALALVRILTKPAVHSKLKPATYSNFIPATIPI
jgi:hypothetical protein